MRKTLLALAAASVAVPTHRPGRRGPASRPPLQGCRSTIATAATTSRAALSRNDRMWRGNDGRYYCKRDNGTTGLIIGAAGGALAGRMVDTRGDRATGTCVGAALGALLGREIDRGELRCR